ncbi:MAG: hypothetical protein M1827_001068 [Pycnora praestabilis]|nr:MAG: hypothetical protein M1827_001068 [Pycnora praestabilis]
MAEESLSLPTSDQASAATNERSKRQARLAATTETEKLVWHAKRADAVAVSRALRELRGMETWQQARADFKAQMEDEARLQVKEKRIAEGRHATVKFTARQSTPPKDKNAVAALWEGDVRSAVDGKEIGEDAKKCQGTPSWMEASGEGKEQLQDGETPLVMQKRLLDERHALAEVELYQTPVVPQMVKSSPSRESNSENSELSALAVGIRPLHGQDVDSDPCEIVTELIARLEEGKGNYLFVGRNEDLGEDSAPLEQEDKQRVGKSQIRGQAQYSPIEDEVMESQNGASISDQGPACESETSEERVRSSLYKEENPATGKAIYNALYRLRKTPAWTEASTKEKIAMNSIEAERVRKNHIAKGRAAKNPISLPDINRRGEQADFQSLCVALCTLRKTANWINASATERSLLEANEAEQEKQRRIANETHVSVKMTTAEAVRKRSHDQAETGRSEHDEGGSSGSRRHSSTLTTVVSSEENLWDRPKKLAKTITGAIRDFTTPYEIWSAEVEAHPS